ncbi:LOW QUALITY PROTEIN: lysosomal alpha-mannosidase [Boleophthalmus pectinirostris]|uniref:LOW QUALITY PROTEIN: lysosomal alpha-mannosidase n=1 Tax=Boleophthalmus pectinirostris TaxID=150288 RepID=UPI00242CD4E3|nr:LOW QUALITY PROTEIN: lysosomal alpha-mannosidase [Boleophthalmus pectinirostris]
MAERSAHQRTAAALLCTGALLLCATTASAFPLSPGEQLIQQIQQQQEQQKQLLQQQEHLLQEIEQRQQQERQKQLLQQQEQLRQEIEQQQRQQERQREQRQPQQQQQQRDKCGYESCHVTKPGLLNVHLVPHTHDDVGWLKTVDQYFYGDRNDIQHAGVQYILDSVVEQLLKNHERRFIYVETAFFYRWWKRQNQDMKNDVRTLVNQGRLEFVNGGWVMSDEASTHYSSVIDQMTLGLRFLNQTFGECGRPRVAWHIDPFGHAREHASMFAQVNTFTQTTKKMKKKQQQLFFSFSLSLCPGILPNGYNPPEGFCWDQSCDDAPIRDDPDLEDYNVDDVVQRFLHIAKAQANVYKTNHIVMTMGSDFQYENANLWYKNLDKLIDYVNERQKNGSNVNLLYSTPSCYLQELHRANRTWALKTDDFFPYADAAHDFWTGYFSSRPALKRYERRSNGLLQTCNQLEVLGGPVSRDGPFGKGETLTMKKSLAVAQHHDAVSGTSKQHVANDYARRLANGWNTCQVVVSNSLSALSGSAAPRVYCDLLNISVCSFTESSPEFTVTVFNPLGRSLLWPVRLPVNGSRYSVSDPGGNPVDSQVAPVSDSTRDLRRGRGFAVNELVFEVQAPPLGFSSYTVSQSQDRTGIKTGLNRNQTRAETRAKTGLNQGPVQIENKFVRATFDPDTGLLSGLMNLETKQKIDLTQNFYWYNGSDGNNSDSDQPSGAYIFRPNSSTPFVISKTAKIQLIQTSVVQEVRQVFSSWVSQVVRLYSGSRALELEWTVGPVPVQDDLGKEVMTRLDTNIKSGGVFFTDSNGRELLRRRKDFRPTWKLKQSEPIAGNYYPINSRAFITDEEKQLTVVTDRSQGGSSIQNGSLEIMLHRRLLYDDVRGVAEPLNETSELFPDGLVVRGTLLLSLDPPKSAADKHRPLGQETVLQPLLSFTKGKPEPSAKLTFSGLQAALPPAVHLLTLSQWDSDSVLLRLEHQFQTRESRTNSEPVTVNLQKLFSTLEVLGFSELNLSANQWKEDVKRFDWTPETEEEKWEQKSSVDPSFWDVTLRPMEIRTFLLRVRVRV